MGFSVTLKVDQANYMQTHTLQLVKDICPCLLCAASVLNSICPIISSTIC